MDGCARAGSGLACGSPASAASIAPSAASCTSPQVVMPAAASCRSVVQPTPGRSATGTLRMNSARLAPGRAAPASPSSSRCDRSATPSGLAILDAILATSLLRPQPMLATQPVSSRILRLILCRRSPRPAPSGCRPASAVTSMYTSSQLTGSMLVLKFSISSLKKAPVMLS